MATGGGGGLVMIGPEHRREIEALRGAGAGREVPDEVLGRFEEHEVEPGGDEILVKGSALGIIIRGGRSIVKSGGRGTDGCPAERGATRRGCER